MKRIDKQFYRSFFHPLRPRQYTDTGRNGKIGCEETHGRSRGPYINCSGCRRKKILTKSLVSLQNSLYICTEKIFLYIEFHPLP